MWTQFDPGGLKLLLLLTTPVLVLGLLTLGSYWWEHRRRAPARSRS